MNVSSLLHMLLRKIKPLSTGVAVYCCMLLQAIVLSAGKIARYHTVLRVLLQATGASASFRTALRVLLLASGAAAFSGMSRVLPVDVSSILAGSYDELRLSLNACASAAVQRGMALYCHRDLRCLLATGNLHATIVIGNQTQGWSCLTTGE